MTQIVASVSTAPVAPIDNLDGRPVSVYKVTAGGPGNGQTIKTFNSAGGVSLSSGATVNLYTVAAGKTFYLTDLYFSADSATPLLCQLKAGGAVILEGYVSTTAPLDMVGIESQPTAAGGTVVSVVFPTANGKNGTYMVFGYEM